jgi:hypothetical protein
MDKTHIWGQIKKKQAIIPNITELLSIGLEKDTFTYKFFTFLGFREVTSSYNLINPQLNIVCF